MCGIVGVVDFHGGEVSPDSVRRAADKIAGRGIDDSGCWVSEGCGLGHRRLSIIDLSEAGHQPLESHDSRYVMVYNGELYNFKEIKKELEQEGVKWRGHSDTEVLLEAYCKWGKSCLDRFDGMFALAIWDRQERVLFTARDRYGEKPFYYYWDGRRFAFASRPTPLFILLPDLSPEYDEQGLRLYLESGYIPAPYSAHKSIHKLRAGHWMTVSESGTDEGEYWNLGEIETDHSWATRSQNDLLDELDEILSRSVKQRMISDVPLGAFLSGGIDSSLIVAMMNRHADHPIQTFTIGFDEPGYDESEHAQAVADHLGTDHHCQYLNVDNLLYLMPEFLKQYDEPFFDSAAFPTMAVSRLARENVTVVLTGDAGDELFGGYHYYRIAKALNPLFKLPGGIRRGMAWGVGLIPKHNMKLLSAALLQPNSARAFAFSRSIAKDFQGVLTSSVLGRTEGLGDVFEREAASFPAGLHASEEGMRLDGRYTLNDDYLQKTDVATMSYSLEARAPLLGREVVEWALRLPINWKVRGVGNKYLLRELLYRNVPREIVDRPKRGFGVPIDGWLRGQLREWAVDRIADPEYYKGLPLDQKAVMELFQLHESGARNVHPLLWAVLMLLEFNVRLRRELAEL